MGGSSSNQDIFDVRKIRRLIQLMNEHDLSEMDLRQGDMRIQLRRVRGSVASEASPRPPSGGPSASSPETARQPEARPAVGPVETDQVAVITSPMVGTFYAAPDPETEPYVKVGDTVSPETTVCIVEAMKVFNEIQAEVSGKILAVLVDNGEPVEYGQPLFRVEVRQ